MKGNKFFKPRWLARFIAGLLGYFWMPCKKCETLFAGFEVGDLSATENYKDKGGGYVLCPGCSRGNDGNRTTIVKEDTMKV